MVVATEELSWAPSRRWIVDHSSEILTRALVKGGTRAEATMAARLASGEVLAAVAVTEPDFGSDVAGVTTSATKTDGGWLINAPNVVHVRARATS